MPVAPFPGPPATVSLVRTVSDKPSRQSAEAAKIAPFNSGSGVGRDAMENAGVGWIAAIIIGGLAGWLAEKFMKSEMGLLMNIVLGIVGAAIASAVLSWFGITLAGWLGYLVAGFIGSCVLIGIGRALKRG